VEYAINADGYFVVRFFVEIIIAESHSNCNISGSFSYLQNHQKAIIAVLYFAYKFTHSTSERTHYPIPFCRYTVFTRDSFPLYPGLAKTGKVT